MARSSSYSMKNVAVAIDGQKVTGWWDGDDAFQIEPVGDVGTLLVGANGDSIFSQRAGRPHTITLRLQHTSPTHRLLHQKWAMQQADGVKVSPFSVTANDVDSGEGGAADQCFIQTAPSDQKGVAAAVRTWVLVTGDWAPNVPNA